MLLEIVPLSLNSDQPIILEKEVTLFLIAERMRAILIRHIPAINPLVRRTGRSYPLDPIPRLTPTAICGLLPGHTESGVRLLSLAFRHVFRGLGFPHDRLGALLLLPGRFLGRRPGLAGRNLRVQRVEAIGPGAWSRNE